MSTPSTSLSDCLSSRGVSDDEVRLTSHPPRRLWSCQRGPDGPESRVHGNNGLRCWSAGYCRGPGLVNETMNGLHKILVATALVAGGRTAPALANKVENIDRMSMGMPNATFPETTPSVGNPAPNWQIIHGSTPPDGISIDRDRETDHATCVTIGRKKLCIATRPNNINRMRRMQNEEF